MKGKLLRVAPDIEILTMCAKRYSEKYTDAHFIQVDVDESPDIAQELGIRAMPTFIVFKDGKVFDTVVGAYPDKLETAIGKAIAV